MSSVPQGVELEDRPCPLGCQRADSLVLEGMDRISHVPGIFRIVRCNNCGLMRTNPRPTAVTIGVYYPDNYAPYLAAEHSAAVASGLKGKLRLLLALDAKRVPPISPGRMLEIGCASGAYLEQMRSAGWQTTGIEFSDSAAEQARSKGLEVLTGSVESVPDIQHRFDVVAAWMVLEHLHDPVSALERIRTWTKPEGYLIASVPVNSDLFLAVFGNAAYDLHLPNHLCHFSVSTIKQLLARAGWRVEAMRWQRNPNTLLCTLEYVARDRRRDRLARVLSWMRTSPKMATLRVLLGLALGVTRTSGRVEIWARPTRAAKSLTCERVDPESASL
jgi:SAM-dependent methyltransferase